MVVHLGKSRFTL